MGLKDVLRPPASQAFQIMDKELLDAEDFVKEVLSEKTLNLRHLFNGDLFVTAVYLAGDNDADNLDQPLLRSLLENYLGAAQTDEELLININMAKEYIAKGKFTPLPYFLRNIIDHAGMMTRANKTSWINMVRGVGQQLFKNVQAADSARIETYLNKMLDDTEEAELRFKDEISDLERAMTERGKMRTGDFKEVAEHLKARSPANDDEPPPSSSREVVPVPTASVLEKLPPATRQLLKHYGSFPGGSIKNVRDAKLAGMGREEELTQLAIALGQPKRHHAIISTKDLTEGNRLLSAAAKHFAHETNASIPGGAIVMNIDWQSLFLDALNVYSRTELPGLGEGGADTNGNIPLIQRLMVDTLFRTINNINEESNEKIILAFEDVGKIREAQFPYSQLTYEYFNQAVRRFPHLRLMLTLQEKHVRDFEDLTPELGKVSSHIRLENPQEETLLALLAREAQEHNGLEVSKETLVYLSRLVKKEFNNAAQVEISSRILERAATIARMGKAPKLTNDLIDLSLAQFMGVNKDYIGKNLFTRINEAIPALEKEIFGQDAAIKIIRNALRPLSFNLSDPDQPAAIMLFNGPTGVGKTEVSRILARAYGGSDDALIKIDGTDYYAEHTKSRIIGSPPGYVGYKDVSIFEKLLKNPNAVVLIDEFDKMHPDVQNIFMSAWDNGYIILSDGRKVDLTKTVWCITGNFGAHKAALNVGKPLGFKDVPQDDDLDEIMQDIGQEEIEKALPPELVGRIHHVIPFNYLKRDVVDKVIQKYLDKELGKLAEKLPNVQLTYSPEVIEELRKKAYSKLKGVRPVKNAVKSHILSEALELLAQKVEAGEHDFERDNLSIHIESIHKPFTIWNRDAANANPRFNAPVFQ
ncbi:MAG: AAA domain-containing protein [Alphaproteobacteria bacterium]|nr:AAA domain-containing protein [Alphaproteobacteria bacterium]